MKAFRLAVVALLFASHAWAAFASVEARTANTAAATTTPAVTIPSDGVASKLIVCAFSPNSNPTISWTGTGFTQLIYDATAAFDGLAVIYRWTDGSEGASITPTLGTSSETVWSCLRIAGAINPATQAPQASTVNRQSVNANPDPPSLTPTGGAKDYLWIAIANTNNGSRTVTIAPSSYGNLNAFDSASAGAGVAIGTAERQLNAASEDPGTFTVSTTSEVGSLVVAIHPAAAAAVKRRPIIDASAGEWFAR